MSPAALPAKASTVGGSIFLVLWYIAICLVFIELICYLIKRRGPLRWCYAAITSRFKTKEPMNEKTVIRKKKKRKKKKKNRR